MVDDEVKDELMVTLNPDEVRTVSFEVSAPRLGTFSVEIDGLSGSYLVTESSPSPSPEPTPEPTPKPQGGIPGFPMESLIVGLAVLILVLWFFQRTS
jgi:hypothetical protein